jgi:hypothetical protein
MLISLITSLWIARSYLHHLTWLVAVGVGLGAAVLCVILLVNRSYDGPYLFDLVVAVGLGPASWVERRT